MDSLESISYTLQVGSKEEKLASLFQLNEYRSRQASKDITKKVFQILQEALSDSLIEVKLQTLAIVNDFVSLFKREIDPNYAMVLPKIVQNLGDNEVVYTMFIF